MSQALEINGTELITIKAAAKLSHYSRDYITKLAREEKIVAYHIGKQWHVALDSLTKYTETVSADKEMRRQKLSEERKSERVNSEFLITKKNATNVFGPSYSINTQIFTAAVVVLVLLAGVTVQTFFSGQSFGYQSASAVAVRDDVTKNGALDTATSQQSLVATEQINFSHEAVRSATFADMREGLLLLPHSLDGTVAVNAVDMFSDDVTVSTDSTGQQYVTHYNSITKQTEKIPFIVVPVSKSHTP